MTGPSKLQRWNAVRRRVKKDPAWRRRQAEWEFERRLVRANEERVEAAGFNNPRHYDRTGKRYCVCGTVQDHNKRFDELNGRQT